MATGFSLSPSHAQPWPLVRAAVPAAVSAVLFGLTFPPTGWTPVAWVALAPLLVALRQGGIRQALFVSWLWCVVGASVAGDWFPKAVAQYFDQPMLVALALFVGVFTFMAAPYFMVLTAAYRALARRFDALLPFLAAAAWVGAELGRGRLFTATPVFIGNPWGLVGYAHADILPLVQVASITGIYGVSFVVVCVNAALAELWFTLRDPHRSRRRALAVLAASGLPAVAALAYGSAVLRAADGAQSGAGAVSVAVVQGNVSLGSRWRSDYYGRNLETYLELTDQAARDGAPAIVFWPEAAMTFFVEDEPLYRKSIARVLQSADVELIAGGPRRVEGAETLFFNSIFRIDPDGTLAARYDKEYLVPFAEYFPLGVDVLRRRFGRIRVFEHGDEETAPIASRAGPAGIIVCNEAMLPEVASERVAAGATYLLNPSNDTWISDEKYSEEQFDIALMRAIEQRRYLVRVSTAGPSAIVDPFGRVQTRSSTLTREVLHGTIRPSTAISVYGRVGDLFSLSCMGAVALALLSVRPRRELQPE